jgi:hypothetical protein
MIQTALKCFNVWVFGVYLGRFVEKILCVVDLSGVKIGCGDAQNMLELVAVARVHQRRAVLLVFDGVHPVPPEHSAGLFEALPRRTLISV